MSETISTHEALLGNPVEHVRASITERLSALQIPQEVLEELLVDQQGMTFETPTTQPEDHQELFIRPWVNQTPEGRGYTVFWRLVDYRHGETKLGDWSRGDKVTVDGNGMGDLNVEGLCEEISKASSVRFRLP